MRGEQKQENGNYRVLLIYFLSLWAIGGEKGQRAEKKRKLEEGCGGVD